MKKQKWAVTLITEKIMIVTANDYDEAREKAEAKAGLRWSAETACEVEA